MPKAKRPQTTTSTGRQDEYEALFIERFGEAAWAAERARDAAEAALHAGCKVQAFLDDPITEHSGAHNPAGMIRCDCAGRTRDRQQPTPSDLGRQALRCCSGRGITIPKTRRTSPKEHAVSTQVEGSFDDPQRNQATATHARRSPPRPSRPPRRRPPTSPGISATRCTASAGPTRPTSRPSAAAAPPGPHDSAPTCADCTTAMRACAIELLASIRDPRLERGCLQDAARILSWWAEGRVPDDPRVAPDVRDEVAALLADWAAPSNSKR